MRSGGHGRRQDGSGDPGGSVTIRVHPAEASAVLTVRGTGIGIPSERCERIFERLCRVEKSRSKEAGGTGPELSVVRHAVMIHDGKIEVNSEIGKGTNSSQRCRINRNRPLPRKKTNMIDFADTRKEERK